MASAVGLPTFSAACIVCGIHLTPLFCRQKDPILVTHLLVDVSRLCAEPCVMCIINYVLLQVCMFVYAFTNSILYKYVCSA
jgi:hypothetical protein